MRDYTEEYRKQGVEIAKDHTERIDIFYRTGEEFPWRIEETFYSNGWGEQKYAEAFRDGYNEQVERNNMTKDVALKITVVATGEVIEIDTNDALFLLGLTELWPHNFKGALTNSRGFKVERLYTYITAPFHGRFDEAYPTNASTSLTALHLALHRANLTPVPKGKKYRTTIQGHEIKPTAEGVKVGCELIPEAELRTLLAEIEKEKF